MITSFIITSATLLSNFVAVSGEGSDSQYYYNASYDDGRLSAMYVLQPEGKYLRNKLNYKFKYDSDDRLVEKQVMTWDDCAGKWRETEILRYDYTCDSIVLTLLRNRENTGCFIPVERYSYTIFAPHVTAIDMQRWDSDKRDFVSIDKTLWIGDIDTMTKNIARIDKY